MIRPRRRPEPDRLPCTLTALGGCERSPSVRQAHCVRVDAHLEHGKRQRRHLVEVHVLKVFERPDHLSMPVQKRLIAADMVTAPHSTG
jgi:hypothetical protein